MADSAAFELASGVLERETLLDRLEARGTVRLVLKAAGLDSRNVSPDQMAVVVTKLLDRELASRGVEAGDGICATLAAQLAGMQGSDAAETPEAVFARLGAR